MRACVRMCGKNILYSNVLVYAHACMLSNLHDMYRPERSPGIVAQSRTLSATGEFGHSNAWHDNIIVCVHVHGRAQRNTCHKYKKTVTKLHAYACTHTHTHTHTHTRHTSTTVQTKSHKDMDTDDWGADMPAYMHTHLEGGAKGSLWILSRCSDQPSGNFQPPRVS